MENGCVCLMTASMLVCELQSPTLLKGGERYG